MKRLSAFAGMLIVCVTTCASAQEPTSTDTRAQYPAFLSNSYFDFNLGSIGYLFTGTQLEPGFVAESIDKPRLAVRVDFFGHHITKHFAAQVTYMRPVRFVAYNNVNGDAVVSQVSNAYAGLTLVWNVPLNTSVSAYGEGGWGVTSRSGFEINGVVALQRAHYAAGLVGGGIAYHVTPNLDLTFGATYSPGRKSFSQPSTRLFTTGLRYALRRRSPGQPRFRVRVSRERRSPRLLDESVDVRRQHLVLADDSDFLGRQRGDEERLHARLPAQCLPHQEGVRVRSRRQRVVLDQQRERNDFPHALCISALPVLHGPVRARGRLFQLLAGGPDLYQSHDD
jgi:opacity protein-like surface antigen